MVPVSNAAYVSDVEKDPAVILSEVSVSWDPC